MGSTIVSTGEKIACDDTMTVFVHGAYNLGPVLENRLLSTTAAHPGEHVTHVQTAGGEDYFLIGPDKTAQSYGILEVDFGLIADCSVDYTHTTDNVPAIPYHWNPGAMLRNIVCVDPVSIDVTPDHVLHTNSGVPGAFKAVTEAVLVDPAGAGTGEAFTSGVVIGDMGSHISSRAPLRQAYFLADPSAGYNTVAYICYSG